MNLQNIRTISLITIFSITLSACGGGSDGSAEVIPPVTIVDSDGDSVEDSKDAFPNDASESVDTDGDGVGDNADVFPTDVTEWADDNDNGIGDNADAFQVNIGGPTGEEGDCSAATEGINWDALFTKNCSKLSDYNLFQESDDPTDNPNAGGVPYSLSTALFTDYTTKYRYIFIPEGGKAEYTQSEVLNFPVGSVLVKTFAMPADTSSREGEELVIETRLLIHRADGWMALPYYWNTEDDATLAIAGKLVENTVTVHKGEELVFTYAVPKATSCTSCHARAGYIEADISPIGPKARFLNSEHRYSSGNENQLKYLEHMQLLTGLPSDISTVEKALVFNDSIDVSLLSDEELIDTTEGYLDINCAHCHRDGGAGAAGASGLQVEYQRTFSDETAKFGVCKTPVAGGHQDYSYDVVPGEPDSSYLHFRMNTTDPRHKMPELGRSIVHIEGVALVREWITRLQAPSCP